MRGISVGLACAVLVLIGAPALEAKPRCPSKAHCVALPERPVRGALAALLTASERPGFSNQIRFPTLTEVFGPDGPAAYRAIDAAHLAALSGPATARAAQAGSGTVGGVGYTTQGGSDQTGGKGNEQLTDNGGFLDTASDSSSAELKEGSRVTTWKVNIGRPCPGTAGIVYGAVEGETTRKVAYNVGPQQFRRLAVTIVVTGALRGYVGNDAQLKFSDIDLDIDAKTNRTSPTGKTSRTSSSANATVTIGDVPDRVSYSGPSGAEFARDSASNVLVGLVAAAADRAMRRAERIWRTPNRCAKLKLTALPKTIMKGQSAKVRAHLRAYNREDVGLGTVRATPAGATVAPARDVTDHNGIARFTVTARSDAAALVTRAVSRAGVARATIALGGNEAFAATLDAVRTDTWTSHTTRERGEFDDPPVCNVDGSGTERISTPPESFAGPPVYYNDGQGLVLGFMGYLVLNRNGTLTDSCDGNASTAECGSDWMFETLTPLEVVNQGDFVQLRMGGGLTNIPRISCPTFAGPFCEGQPEIVNTPAPLPRAALRDRTQKTITLEGSTVTTLKNDCAEPGVSTTEQDEVKFEWKITLVRQ